MKMIIMLAALVAVALARPQHPEVTLLKFDNDNGGLGNYNFGYELSDGTAREEAGELKSLGKDEDAVVVRGSFTFVTDNGAKYVVNYIADENGYQPKWSKA